GANPAMRRCTEQLRGVEGRQVWSPEIILSLKSRPVGIDEKTGEAEEYQKRLHPPPVPARSLAEAARGPEDIDRRHGYPLLFTRYLGVMFKILHWSRLRITT